MFHESLPENIDCNVESMQLHALDGKHDISDPQQNSAADESGQYSNSKGTEPLRENPEFLAHRLLMEFGKTRTNYSTLVPRVVEVMRIYRDYGAGQSPVPVVTNLDDLLNDEALMRIEHRYPDSIESGFLVLCTERRALRSGGGGKYYFMDSDDRLVGCHKSDLGNYAHKGILKQGPVLLKNLIFVFIMRAAYGLDPRSKSSNPQRLLEFYENLAKQGKASDIQRLVRVWSMEIYPEAPYDNGFPHCTLLWVKRMSIGAHISKWKHSQWQATQFRTQYESNSHSHLGGAMMYRPEGTMDMYTEANGLENSSVRRPKRRRITDEPNQLSSCYDPIYNVHSIHSNQAEWLGMYDEQTTPDFPFPRNDLSWDTESVAAVYERFSDLAFLLKKQDMIDWSVLILDRLNDSVLGAAMELIFTTFGVSNDLGDLSRDSKALRYDILKTICDVKERDRMVEALRILLACLVQQQRLERILPVAANPSSLQLNETGSSLMDELRPNDGQSDFRTPPFGMDKPVRYCNNDDRDIQVPVSIQMGLDQLLYPNHWEKMSTSTQSIALGNMPLEEHSYYAPPEQIYMDEHQSDPTCIRCPSSITSSHPVQCISSEVVIGQPAEFGDESCCDIDVQEGHPQSSYDSGNDSEPSTAVSSSMPFHLIQAVSTPFIVKEEYTIESER